MDERKQVAADDARPLKEQATAKSQQAAQWSQRISDLKKAWPRDDHAIYDLKAVNPHKRPVADTHTPEELMDIIEAKGQEVAEALAALRMCAKEVR